MEGFCICRLCRQIFRDSERLTAHQIAQHPLEYHKRGGKLAMHQYRSRMNSRRLPSYGGDLTGRNDSLAVSVQNYRLTCGGTMNLNDSGKSAAYPPHSFMNMQQGEETSMMLPFTDQRFKQVTFENKNANNTHRLVSMGLNDVAAKRNKWDPPIINWGMGTNQNVSNTNFSCNNDESIITQPATEGRILRLNEASTSVTIKPSCRTAKEEFQGNKNSAPSVTSITPRKTSTRVGGNYKPAIPAMAEIMQTLRKMKLINQQFFLAKKARESAKCTSVNGSKERAKRSPPSTMQQEQQVKRYQPIQVSKTPQVWKSKQKVVSGNFQNTLTKLTPGERNSSTGKVKMPSLKIPPISPRRHVERFVEEQKSMNVHFTDQQCANEKAEKLTKPKTQAKKIIPPPAPKGYIVQEIGHEGKAPSQKKDLITNRFNLIDPSENVKVEIKLENEGPKRKFKDCRGRANLASSSTTGRNKQDSVVAKKSHAAKVKKGKYVTLRRLKAYVPTMPGTDYDLPDLSAVGWYHNEHEEPIWICLVCEGKEKNESSEDMIGCETCDDWYHWDCVGMRRIMAEDDPWYCKRCIYRSTCNPQIHFRKLFKDDILI